MPCFTLEIHPRYAIASPVDTRRRKKYEVESCLWAFHGDRWEPAVIAKTGKRLELMSMIDDSEFTLPANEVQLHCAQTAPKHGNRVVLFNTSFQVLRDLVYETGTYEPRMYAIPGPVTLARLNRFRLTYYRVDYPSLSPIAKLKPGDSVWLSYEIGRRRARVISVGAEIGVVVESDRPGVEQMISVEPHRLDTDLETVRAGDWLGPKIGHLVEFDGEIYTSSKGWRGDREKLFELFEETEPEMPDDFDPNRVRSTVYPEL